MRRDDLLDLNDILQHPGRRLEVDVSTELPSEEDLDLLRPLEGILEGVSTGNVLLITGKFNTRMVIECARCAGPLEVEVEFEIDEQFPVEGIPSSLSAMDYARVAPDEPFEMFDGNNLMVEILLRQALWIAVPMQPLCSFGWDGPCPVAEEASAVPRNAAGRPEFSALQNLMQREDGTA
ncbi:MAG: YceD family protein [Fimbriimonas sp.]